MKKKTWFGLAAILALPSLINYLIFENAKRKTSEDSNSKYYDWKFGKIRYIVAGQGEPVLLVHGIGAGASLYEWEQSIQNLSARYQVFAIDLLGFGHSEKPKLSYSSYLYITLINNFIEDVIGRPVCISASSHSASFAVMAYSFRPDLYKKMVLISPMGIGSSHIPVAKKDAWVRRLIESPIYGTLFYNFICSLPYSDWFLSEKCYSSGYLVGMNTLKRYYESAHYGGSNCKYPIAAFWGNYLNVNIEKQLEKIDIPIYVIWGEENTINPVYHLDTIVDLNPNIETAVFEDVKLLPHEENHKGFYRLCRGFFG